MLFYFRYVLKKNNAQQQDDALFKAALVKCKTYYFDCGKQTSLKFIWKGLVGDSCYISKKNLMVALGRQPGFKVNNPG